MVLLNLCHSSRLGVMSDIFPDNFLMWLEGYHGPGH